MDGSRRKTEIARVVRLPSTPSTSAPAKEMAVALERLTAMFGRPTGWDVAVRDYREALGDLTSEQLEAAMRKLMRHHKGFMPKPAEIREAAGLHVEEEPRGWAHHCACCGCELSEPESRRAGYCRICRVGQ